MRTHPSKVTLPNTATKRAARTSNPFILLLEVKFLIVSNPFIYRPTIMVVIMTEDMRNRVRA